MDWKRFRSIRAGFSCQLFTLILAVQLFSFWLPFAGWFSGCSEPPIDIIVRQWRSCAKGIHAVWDFCNGQKHTEPKRLRTSTINAIETHWNILKHIETYWNILKLYPRLGALKKNCPSDGHGLPLGQKIHDRQNISGLLGSLASPILKPQASRKAAKDFGNSRECQELWDIVGWHVACPEISTASIRFSRTLHFSGPCNAVMMRHLQNAKPLYPCKISATHCRGCSYVLSGLQAACPFALVFGGSYCGDLWWLWRLMAYDLWLSLLFFTCLWELWETLVLWARLYCLFARGLGCAGRSLPACLVARRPNETGHLHSGTGSGSACRVRRACLQLHLMSFQSTVRLHEVSA